jgi:hypothetical protein
MNCILMHSNLYFKSEVLLSIEFVLVADCSDFSVERDGRVESYTPRQANTGR